MSMLAMRTGTKRISGLFLLLPFVALFLSGPTPPLQVYAWAHMSVTYSQDVGLEQGLQMTFGGDAPCPLCLSLRESAGDSVPPTALSQPPGFLLFWKSTRETKVDRNDQQGALLAELARCCAAPEGQADYPPPKSETVQL
jgi:hypothetical protein